MENKDYILISAMTFIFTTAIIIIGKTQESSSTIIKVAGIAASVICIFFIMRIFLSMNKGTAKGEPNA